MPIYHVTFGQQYPREPHPTFPAAHRDGWVDVVACDLVRAREIAFQALGVKWSEMYPDDDQWRQDRRLYYPLGCLATFSEEKPCPNQ